MVYKKGFSLISFVFYLLFFSIIVFCVCNLIVFVIIPLVHKSRFYNQRVECFLGTDIFVRDIRCYAHPFEIKSMTPHEIIGGNKKTTVCWRYNDHKLERIEGIYENEKWLKKTTSIVMQNIHDASFVADMHNGSVVGITLQVIPSVRERDKFVEVYVAIRR